MPRIRHSETTDTVSKGGAMKLGLYTAATALDVTTQRHDISAHNLAHMNVPGFRRLLMSQKAVDGLSADGSGRLGVANDERTTDFTHGTISRTGRWLDVALHGEGFFSIGDPSNPRYTRNGVFYRDSQGQLITGDGTQVNGANGAIVIPPAVPDEAITIDNDGRISIRQESGALQVVDEFLVVDFANKDVLESAGTTQFHAPAEAITKPADAEFIQGGREQSNVNSVQEMIRMISSMRHHEAAQRAFRMLAESIEKRISEG